ncbi:MAG: hypothetical protein WDA25_00065 [Paracoccaceae bacterium]
MKKTLIIAALMAAMAPAAYAGPIENACMRSDRAGANRALCGCIQQVADMTLSRGDQRTAARFFKDPQRAQDMRQSGSERHSAFWRKYTAFGSTAEQFCS